MQFNHTVSMKMNQKNYQKDYTQCEGRSNGSIDLSRPLPCEGNVITTKQTEQNDGRVRGITFFYKGQRMKKISCE